MTSMGTYFLKLCPKRSFRTKLFPLFDFKSAVNSTFVPFSEKSSLGISKKIQDQFRHR